MYSSAVLSRSPVVIPSLTWPRISSSVSPTTTPATRILRIWSGVLTSRPLRPNTGGPSALQVREDHVETLGDHVNLAHAVSLAQKTTPTVESRKRRGLLVVDPQPEPDDVLGVIRLRLRVY